MFEFLGDVDDEEAEMLDYQYREVVDKKGSEFRYHRRKQFFRADKQKRPLLRHDALWLLHNCVAHPILAISQRPGALEFHELTSQWLNHMPHTSQGGRPEGHFFKRIVQTVEPKIKDKLAWVVHNAIVHPLIGFFPTKWAFELHDKSAEKMGVPGWV